MITSKLEKALSINIGRIPKDFIHSSVPGQPTPPSTASLTDPNELALFNAWWAKRVNNTMDPKLEQQAYSISNVKAMILTYENFVVTDPSWIAWNNAEQVTREIQYRYSLVRAADAMRRVGTIPISGDPAGTGTPAPAIRDVTNVTPNSTVTITIASPAVVTWTNHGLAVGRAVSFSTTGSLPTGITAGTVYYVSAVIDANTFRVSASLGGSDVNTSGSQSGTHTIAAINATPSLFAGGDISSGILKDIYQVPTGVDLKITDIVVAGLAPTTGYFPSLNLYACSKASGQGVKTNLLYLPLLNQATNGYIQPISFNSPLIVPSGFFLRAEFQTEVGPATGLRASVSIPGFYFD